MDDHAGFFATEVEGFPLLKECRVIKKGEAFDFADGSVRNFAQLTVQESRYFGLLGVKAVKRKLANEAPVIKDASFYLVAGRGTLYDPGTYFIGDDPVPYIIVPKTHRGYTFFLLEML